MSIKSIIRNHPYLFTYNNQIYFRPYQHIVIPHNIGQSSIRTSFIDRLRSQINYNTKLNTLQSFIIEEVANRVIMYNSYTISDLMYRQILFNVFGLKPRKFKWLVECRVAEKLGRKLPLYKRLYHYIRR